MWALELATLTWRPVSGVKSAPPTPQPPPQEGAALPPPPPGGLPPCAGHALLAWSTQLLCLGGHTKARAPASRATGSGFVGARPPLRSLAGVAPTPAVEGPHASVRTNAGIHAEMACMQPF